MASLHEVFLGGTESEFRGYFQHFATFGGAGNHLAGPRHGPLLRDKQMNCAMIAQGWFSAVGAVSGVERERTHGA
jgi:hypothetical protein